MPPWRCCDSRFSFERCLHAAVARYARQFDKWHYFCASFAHGARLMPLIFLRHFRRLIFAAAIFLHITISFSFFALLSSSIIIFADYFDFRSFRCHAHARLIFTIIAFMLTPLLLLPPGHIYPLMPLRRHYAYATPAYAITPMIFDAAYA
jgi:hypothetical protein